MAKLNMFVNDIEVVANKNFTVKQQYLNTTSTVLNNVYPLSWEDDKDYVSRFYFPKDYSNCEIYLNDELTFAGIVKNSGDIELNPRQPKFSAIQILDYKCLLSEGRNLDFVITNKTVSEAIAMVINAVADYGFIVGNIEITNNSIIGAYSTLNKSAFDVLQYLSEISQSRWGTRMINKETIAVDFYDPIFIPRENDIEYTKEYWEENKIVDMSFSFSTRDYRNKQVILSDLVFASINYTEQPLVTGYLTTYQTEQSIGRIIEILVNDVPKTFITEDYRQLGATADFYYKPGEAQFISEDILPAGTSLKITYTALVKGREISYNNSEINRIAGQIDRNGTIERYETRNDILDSIELQQVARTYIKFNGKPEIILKVVTQDKDIFEIGKQVHFNFSGIPELNTDYLIKTKEMAVNHTAESRTVFYTYSLSSNFEAETQLNYFDNQRRKFKGNISESQFITRNIDIESEAMIIFDNLEVTEVIIEEGNVLNSGLNSPFNQ